LEGTVPAKPGDFSAKQTEKITGERKKGPTIRPDSRGLPTQLGLDLGGVQVGPAYASFDEALQANPKNSQRHIAEVILFSASGRMMANWWEVSENVGVRGVGRAGDTEQKALTRVNLKPGQLLEIRGIYNPCTLDKGCDAAMQNAAEESGAEIVYRAIGTITGKEKKDAAENIIKRGSEQHYPKD
jgi:hypothetical protein